MTDAMLPSDVQNLKQELILLRKNKFEKLFDKEKLKIKIHEWNVLFETFFKIERESNFFNTEFFMLF